MAQHIAASGAERARLRNPEVTVSSDVLPDDAASALLDAAHESSALVTGSRGRGGIAGLLLGSVRPAVAARARPCRVKHDRAAEPAVIDPVGAMSIDVCAMSIEKASASR